MQLEDILSVWKMGLRINLILRNRFEGKGEGKEGKLIDCFFIE